MRKFAAFTIVWSLVLAFAAMPADSAEICDEGNSGKIDTTGDPASVTITAPEGFVIHGYCYKAGQSTEYVVVDPAVESVTFEAANGKAISHYSFVYYQEEPPSDTTTTTAPTTTAPTTTTTTSTTVPTSTTTVPPPTTTTTTTVPPTTITTPTTPTTLPFTGGESRALGVLGGLLLGGGLGVILWDRLGGRDL